MGEQLYETHWAMVRYTVERGSTETALDIFNFKTLDENLVKLEHLLSPVLDIVRELEALSEWKAPLKSGATVAACLYIFWHDALWLLLPGSVVLVSVRTAWAGFKKYVASLTSRHNRDKSVLSRNGSPLPAHQHDSIDDVKSPNSHRKPADREPRDRDASLVDGEGGRGGVREGELGVSSSAAPRASLAAGASLTRRALSLGSGSNPREEGAQHGVAAGSVDTQEANGLGRRQGDAGADRSVGALNGHGGRGGAHAHAEEFAGSSSQGGDAHNVWGKASDASEWLGDEKGVGAEVGAVVRKEDGGKTIGTPGSWFKSIGDKVVYARELKKNIRKLVADNIVEVLGFPSVSVRPLACVLCVVCCVCERASPLARRSHHGHGGRRSAAKVAPMTYACSRRGRGNRAA